VRLEAAGLGALHLFAHLATRLHVHRVVRERPVFDQLLKVRSVHPVLDGLVSRARTSGWSP
jgi:hypothetical protein